MRRLLRKFVPKAQGAQVDPAKANIVLDKALRAQQKLETLEKPITTGAKEGRGSSSVLSEVVLEENPTESTNKKGTQVQGFPSAPEAAADGMKDGKLPSSSQKLAQMGKAVSRQARRGPLAGQ